MFEAKEPRLWAAGLACVACLRGGRVRWFRSLGEASRFALEFDLPRGMNAGDVAALHPAPQGVTVVCRDGSFAHYDLTRRAWTLAASALTDGAAL